MIFSEISEICENYSILFNIIQYYSIMSLIGSQPSGVKPVLQPAALLWALDIPNLLAWISSREKWPCWVRSSAACSAPKFHPSSEGPVPARRWYFGRNKIIIPPSNTNIQYSFLSCILSLVKNVSRTLHFYADSWTKSTKHRGPHPTTQLS